MFVTRFYIGTASAGNLRKRRGEHRVRRLHWVAHVLDRTESLRYAYFYQRQPDPRMALLSCEIEEMLP